MPQDLTQKSLYPPCRMNQQVRPQSRSSSLPQWFTNSTCWRLIPIIAVNLTSQWPFGSPNSNKLPWLGTACQMEALLYWRIRKRAQKRVLCRASDKAYCRKVFPCHQSNHILLLYTVYLLYTALWLFGSIQIRIRIRYLPYIYSRYMVRLEPYTKFFKQISVQCHSKSGAVAPVNVTRVHQRGEWKTWK